jgi:hypothetical protein
VILYHGSNIAVSKIELAKCRPYKDFGTGFYLTVYEEQAKRMATRVTRLYGGEKIVSIFEFDEKAAIELNVCEFEKPSSEWAHFIMNNRNRFYRNITSLECNLDKKYDIVIGPVADDDMALLFRQYMDEFITLETLARELDYRELTNQYSFHTEQAVATLEYKGILNE